jgi:hypothetical protein
MRGCSRCASRACSTSSTGRIPSFRCGPRIRPLPSASLESRQASAPSTFRAGRLFCRKSGAPTPETAIYALLGAATHMCG